jgi:catechol 2,3-dioxygenase-like lactoylglutathione lyase family enzyme
MRTLLQACCVAFLAPLLHAAERPPVVGIANIALRVDNLDEARKFYTGVLGLEEAFHTKDGNVAGEMSCFKVNDHQYVEISPTLQNAGEDRLIRIGFETRDARKLRDYLASKGIPVPRKAGKDPNGNLSFTVSDPDGHTVQFVQYASGSIHSRNFGKHLSARRISGHILHVGETVADPAKADAFYKDVLGFRLQWKGGPTDDRFAWISMMVPDGYDWLEYMVTQTTAPTPQQRGVWHHFALETLDIQQVYKTVLDHGYTPPAGPAIARDGRWLFQMYDKDLTRTEIMVRKPVRTPCCSPNLDDFRGSGQPKHQP